MAAVAGVRVEINRLEGRAADSRPELKLDPVRRHALAVVAGAREATRIRARRVQVATAGAGVVPPAALLVHRAVACLGRSQAHQGGVAQVCVSGEPFTHSGILPQL